MTNSARLYAIRLKFLQDPYIFPNIGRVLQPIGEAIETSIQHIQTVDYKNLTDHHFGAIIDEEADVIENLLGTAFVVCQTYIEAVNFRVQSLRALYKKDRDAELKTTSAEKWNIMAFGSSLVAGSSFSEVQVLDAFANYFKHRDGWVKRDWDKRRDKSKQTVRIICAVGASQGATGNLRAGAEVLGNETYTNMSVFVDILQRWQKNLYNSYREELGLEGLVFI